MNVDDKWKIRVIYRENVTCYCSFPCYNSEIISSEWLVISIGIIYEWGSIQSINGADIWKVRVFYREHVTCYCSFPCYGWDIVSSEWLVCD